MTQKPTDAPSGEASAALILEAARYLGQMREGRALFAVVTAPESTLWRLAVEEFLKSVPEASRVVRVPAPTDSNHVFLEAVLLQLGFDPFESSADDLLRLLSVVLRQSPASAPVIVIEDAQSYGPRVFETLRELARGIRDLPSLPLFVLTGHAGLHRVLDSQGMATVRDLTRQRFDFQSRRAALDSAAAEPALPYATLRLSLNNDPVREIAFDRERLLIGRGPHSDLRIDSRFVSRQHALLIRNADGDWILDLKSTNGTVVNSRVVRQHALGHGDIIGIGNYRLVYHHPTALASASRSEAPRPDPLGETVVMRSLEAVLGADPLPVRSDGHRSSAA